MGNSFRGIVKVVVDQGFFFEGHVLVGKTTFKSIVTKKSPFDLEVLEGTEVFYPSDRMPFTPFRNKDYHLPHKE